MPEIEQHAPREGLKVALREKGFAQCQRMETLGQRTPTPSRSSARMAVAGDSAMISVCVNRSSSACG